MREIHDLVPGTPEWDQFRLSHGGASEAAAMLGMSSTVRRSELLRMKHSGTAKEFSAWVQENILDHGHAVEALARPHVEAMLGADLYTPVLSDGYPSCSTDGLTEDDETSWEHKQWSEWRAAELRAGRLPEEDMPQCQQTMMVCGSKRLLFTVSDGTPEKMLHVWVEPDKAWFERLRAGWEQFQRDLAAYVPPDAAEPAPTAKKIDTLPALRVDVTGMVTASNLDAFKGVALAAIRSVNKNLQTDQDFADAAEAVKWCADVESRLKAAKEHILGQTGSIDAALKAMDDISEEARRVRLDVDKLVANRKEAIKSEIVTKARGKFASYLAELQLEIRGATLAHPMPDFPAVVKGKRTIETMQDAVDTAMAHAKISAHGVAKVLRDGLACIAAESVGFEFLFADRGALASKPVDDLKVLVKARIDAHLMAEEAKKTAQREAPQQVAPIPVAPASVAAPVSQSAAARTINTGEVGRRLGFALPAEFIENTLLVKRSGMDKRAVLWAEADWPAIKSRLVHYVNGLPS